MRYVGTLRRMIEAVRRRRRARGPGLAAAALVVGLVLLTGCDPFGATPAAATATSTIVLPTATPNLAQAAPKILATWLSPIQNGPCPEACSTLKFTARGPVYIVVACNGFQQFADSAPTFEFTLYDANGHQADAFKQQCGDVNNDVVTNVVIPESLAAGPYTLSITNFPWECSVTIIDASRR